MGKFNTRYGVATWVVLGHQFKDNKIPFGCTCMRPAKSYLEFLLKMQILGASSNLKIVILHKPSSHLITSFHLPQKIWSSSVVSLPLHPYSIHHQSLALYLHKCLLHASALLHPRMLLSLWEHMDHHQGLLTCRSSSTLAPLGAICLLQPIKDWVISLDKTWPDVTFQMKSVGRAPITLENKDQNYKLVSKFFIGLLPAHLSSFLCSSFPSQLPVL